MPPDTRVWSEDQTPQYRKRYLKDNPSHGNKIIPVIRVHINSKHCVEHAQPKHKICCEDYCKPSGCENVALALGHEAISTTHGNQYKHSSFSRASSLLFCCSKNSFPVSQSAFNNTTVFSASSAILRASEAPEASADGSSVEAGCPVRGKVCSSKLDLVDMS